RGRRSESPRASERPTRKARRSLTREPANPRLSSSPPTSTAGASTLRLSQIRNGALGIRVATYKNSSCAHWRAEREECHVTAESEIWRSMSPLGECSRMRGQQSHDRTRCGGERDVQCARRGQVRSELHD